MQIYNNWKQNFITYDWQNTIRLISSLIFIVVEWANY